MKNREKEKKGSKGKEGKIERVSTFIFRYISAC